jgi:hypothetical protein
VARELDGRQRTLAKKLANFGNRSKGEFGITRLQKIFS